MQPGSSSADQPEINLWPSIMWRNNLSRKGGNYLLPFMHRAGLPGELRLSSWIVLLSLWPLSIPIYHFPLCLCCFDSPPCCSQRTLAESHPASVFKGIFSRQCYSSDTFIGWWWKCRSPTQCIPFPFHCSNAVSAPRVGLLNLPSQPTSRQLSSPLNQLKPEHRGRSSNRKSWYSSADGSGPFAQYVCYQVQDQKLIVEKHRKCQ